MDDDGTASGVAYIDRTTGQEVEVRCARGGRGGFVPGVRTYHAQLEVVASGRMASRTRAASSDAISAITCTAQSADGYLPQLLGQPSFPDNVGDCQVAWMPRWQNLKNPHEEKFANGYSVYPWGGCRSTRGTPWTSKGSARRSNAK